MDFATKVVTAERLLWERALKASSAEGDERQSSEAEAAFVLVVAPVMEKLVRNTRFSGVRSEEEWGAKGSRFLQSDVCVCVRVFMCIY